MEKNSRVTVTINDEESMGLHGKVVCFLGFGNMAYAMAKGMTESGRVSPDKIIVTGRDMEKLKSRAAELGVMTADTNSDAVKDADIIFLTVKPFQYRDVSGEIMDSLKPGSVVISVAPGMMNNDILTLFPGRNIKPCVIMPNTPSMVGYGMTLMGPSEEMTEEEKNEVEYLLNSFGRTAVMTDKMVAETGALTGCSPAFTYIFIEALSDAGVHMGMDRKTAIESAAQTVMGAAAMVLETGLHPAQLKDMVTSPGGTTIEGVRTLDSKNFRSAAMEAVLSARRKRENQ